MQLENITVSEFNSFVGGSIFTATFVKKDGTVRVMNCRREVKKHLKGGQNTWQPEKRGYVSVYDLQSEGYRVINLETLIELKANGNVIRNTKMENAQRIADAIAVLKSVAKNGNTDAVVNEVQTLVKELTSKAVTIYPTKADAKRIDAIFSTPSKAYIEERIPECKQPHVLARD